MKVSRSGFYQYLKRRFFFKKRDLLLVTEVRAIHKESRESYGSRRMSKALQGRGFPVGRFQARQMMREEFLFVRRKKFSICTTESNHKLKVSKNHLNRDFKTKAMNKKWAGDITYIKTALGWVYLAILMDLYSRKVVGWSMDTKMGSSLVGKAFLMATESRDPLSGFICHSDRGVQYASDEYQKLLKKKGAICSMSRKGNCYDNSVVERFFRSLKHEHVLYKNYKNPKEAMQDVGDYIFFYNNERKHSALEYKTPEEFEKKDLAKNVA